MNINRIAALICHPSLFRRSKQAESSVNEKMILTNQSDTSELDNILPTKQELNRRRRYYGVCLRCGTTLSDKAWCQLCEGQKLQKKFSYWTSGNQYIDNFIQSSQMNPLNKNSYLSWIPFDDLIKFKCVAIGGFSAVYSAQWNRFQTDRMVDVVLKRLHNGQITNPEFLRDQIAVLIYAASQKSTVIHCYGITQHPTEGYMLVMECGEEGDMRNYLRVNNQDLSWSEKIYLLRDTVSALSVLHKREFVHGDLHTGNILKKRTKPSLLNRLGMTNGHKRMCIVDLPLSYVSTQLFGVIPYIAPEVFNNGYYTKASDVYSFGMVMWELAVGQTPYHDYSHDKDLIDDICRGVRPDIEKIIPQFYVDLMTQCWDPEPMKRPSAHMIKASIEGWISTLKKSSVMPSKEQKSILSQIKNSDELAKKSFKRQTRITSMVSSSPTIAATFHSQNLGDILTLDGRSTTSSRKSSNFSSSSYRH